MGRTRAIFLLLSLSLAACASQSQGDADFPDSERSMNEAETEVPDRAEPPKGALWRDDVTATVDAGLGWFLQRVEVQAKVVGGRFVGFEIVDLRPAEFWRGVDLHPGDVVLAVNGKPIERETQAYEAFQSLKTASELRVKLERGGRQRELVYRIVEPPADADTAKSAKAKPAG